MALDVQVITGSGALVAARLCNFPSGKATLLGSHLAWLDSAVRSAVTGLQNPWVDLRGYASHLGFAKHPGGLGDTALNKQLSFARCEAVKARILSYGSKVSFPMEWAVGDAESSGTMLNDDGYWRAVDVYAYATPPPTPIPPTPVPVPPTSTAVGAFRVDLIGWIPQPEVDNPLALLPSFISSLLPAGMADSFFGGDDFSIPAITPAGMRPPIRTFRGSQSLDFEIPSWGAAPTVGLKTIVPGVTTCLNNRRAAGGVVTFSLAARVLASSATVTFSSSDNWYEVNLSGMIIDPIPAAAATALASKVSTVPVAVRPLVLLAADTLAKKATPSLTWDATIRIQRGATLSTLTAANYALYTGSEGSGTLAGATSALAPGTDLIHGKIHFDRWPSAVIYLSFTPSGGTMVTQPIFFSSGLGLPRPEPAFIEVPKLCKLRQLTW